MSLSRQILLLNRHLLAYYKKALEDHEVDLSLVDLLCLSYLYRHGGCRQDDFARDFLWDKAHVARQLQSLEQRGLISRRVHEADKRVKVIETTPEGKSYQALIASIQEGWNRQVFQGYAGDQAELEAALSHLLQKAQTLAIGDKNN